MNEARSKSGAIFSDGFAACRAERLAFPLVGLRFRGGLASRDNYLRVAGKASLIARIAAKPRTSEGEAIGKTHAMPLKRLLAKEPDSFLPDG